MGKLSTSTIRTHSWNTADALSKSLCGTTPARKSGAIDSQHLPLRERLLSNEICISQDCAPISLLGWVINHPQGWGALQGCKSHSQLTICMTGGMLWKKGKKIELRLQLTAFPFTSSNFWVPADGGTVAAVEGLSGGGTWELILGQCSDN